jgi:hypothetical protein
MARYHDPMSRTCLFSILMASVVACAGDAPTANDGLAGVYDLVTIDGMGLPRLERIPPSLDTLYTTGGELRVLSRGRISMVQRSRWHLRVGGPDPEHSDTVIVTYRYSGSELLLYYPVEVLYGPYTDTGVVNDDEITIRTKIFEGGPPKVREYRYRRR